MRRTVDALSRGPICEAYSDGGMIGGTNPSSVGVTWAWCHVGHLGMRVTMASGIITPQEVGLSHLSNNLAEYAAAVRCLKALPEGWNGHFYCDSKITLGRLFWDWECRGLPANWIASGQKAVLRLGRVVPVLLAGHPTKANLDAGMKRDLPVSAHNVWCDKACGEAAKEYVATRVKETHGAI